MSKRHELNRLIRQRIAAEAKLNQQPIGWVVAARDAREEFSDESEWTVVTDKYPTWGDAVERMREIRQSDSGLRLVVLTVEEAKVRA